MAKKKFEEMTWNEITKPLKVAMAKTNMKESDVPELVQRFRKNKRGLKYEV